MKALVRVLRIGALALALVQAASAVDAPAQTAADAASPVAVPEYRVERCCDLCPAVKDEKSYTSDYQQDYKMLVQGRDGWLFRTGRDMTTEFGADAEGEARLKRFADALRARGTEVVLVYLPPRAMVHEGEIQPADRANYDFDLARRKYSEALQRFRNLGLYVAPLDKLVGDPSVSEFYFSQDHHWTERGAKAAAKVVADTIRSIPAFASLPQKRFETTRTGTLAWFGSYQRVVQQLCAFTLPKQYFTTWQTQPADEADLFGEETVPPITLIGTSNSDPRRGYNFSGFMEEELGVEILNEGLVGGDVDGSMMRYLPSDTYQKNPPKIMVWEMAHYGNLSSLRMYRQLTPLVTDGCNGKKIVLSNERTLGAGTTELLFNGAGGNILPLRSSDYLMDIRFSDPTVKDLHADVLYFDGRKESLGLLGNAYVDMKGRFVVEMRDDGDWAQGTFMALQIERPEKVANGAKVSARVCERDHPKPVKRSTAAR